MASENRALQKQSAALMVILTGWDTSMSPSERLFMVNWMLEQITHVQAFLQQRGWANFDGEYKYLNVLSADPSTPPAGAQKWSSVTLLSFKSWDLRKAFMEAYGGTQGTPLYKDARTPVPRHHIRATPSSPQFQRKLEIPIRVLLQALNLKEEAAKGTGKGMLAGKGSRHWTAPMIYSASSMPYPIDLEIRLVSQVAYVWDEYCDKFGENSRKCGDYRQATFSGAPVAATPLLTAPAA